MDTQFLQPETARWLAIGMLAAAIFCAGLGCLLALSWRFDPVRRRLAAVLAPPAEHGSIAEKLAERLDRFAGQLLPKDHGIRKRTIDRLTHAGHHGPNRLVIYYFIRMLCTVSLPILALVLLPLLPKIGMYQMLWAAALAGLVGLIAPSFLLDRQISRRQRILRNALPDAIDLLVVCTEAGLGLNAALQRVAQVLVEIHPALAEELLLVSAEMRAGVERNQALTNLAVRTGLDDLKGLVAIMAQSVRFGTSIAQTLRVYSEEFRDKRMQRADEEAAKLGTKMIFPLAFCLLPGFFIVVMGPAVIKVLAFLPTLSPH